VRGTVLGRGAAAPGDGRGGDRRLPGCPAAPVREPADEGRPGPYRQGRFAEAAGAHSAGGGRRTCRRTGARRCGHRAGRLGAAPARAGRSGQRRRRRVRAGGGPGRTGWGGGRRRSDCGGARGAGDAAGRARRGRRSGGGRGGTGGGAGPLTGWWVLQLAPTRAPKPVVVLFRAPVPVLTRRATGDSDPSPARWQEGEPGSSSLALRPGGWPAAAAWAVWESGSGAVLDGISALLLDGLVNYAEERILVTVPRGRRPVRLPGVVLHTRRTVAAAPGTGLPRVRTETAVGNAAGWASSKRQAARIVVLAVQQGMTSANRLMAEVARRGRVRRPGFLYRLLREVQGGARALGELDFARLCREHGIPPPSRQRVRSGPRGRIYLDAWWDEYQVGVEIDGVQHLQGLHPVADALRDNEVLLSGGPTLRIPSLGLITEPAAFMAQVAKLLSRHGR